MATPGFGFSVGDVLAGLHVVRKLIRALNDTAGSRAAYQRLISELLNLEEALTGVRNLQVDQAQAAQKLALEHVAKQCQGGIETFLNKNAKFKNALGARPSSLSAWRSNLHKIQWALCKESEIEGLRTEIATHSTTLNLILSTIQLSSTKLQSEAVDDCAQLAKIAQDGNDETKALVKKNNQLLTTQADLIVTISSTVANPSSRQQTIGLQDLVQKVLESNMRIFNSVIQIQQLQEKIPPQVERQQPIMFEDAHERLTPFHVEFINSFAAFQAVLEVRFSQVPGLKKVKCLEYAMQDTASKKTLNLSRPWESIFRPGRKVFMSMLFQQVESTMSSCPGYLAEDVQEDNGEDTHIQCSNPACGLWYRRVTEARTAKRSRDEQRDQGSRKRQRMDGQFFQNGNEQDEESRDDDEIRDFRRVQIVHENRESNVTSIPAEKPISGLSQAVLSTSSGSDLSDNVAPVDEVSQSVSQHPGGSNHGSAASEMDHTQTQHVRLGSEEPDDFRQLYSKSTVPKLDRTLIDIFGDELYNYDFGPIPISSVGHNQASVSRPSGLFGQRLQAANDRHSRAYQSPSPTPFRDGSPLAATYQSPPNRVTISQYKLEKAGREEAMKLI